MSGAASQHRRSDGHLTEVLVFVGHHQEASVIQQDAVYVLELEQRVTDICVLVAAAED